MGNDPLVAVVAPGNMGAGIARVLTTHGLTVITSLDGRSDESRMRAAQAGMRPVPNDVLRDADILLSILPPAHALVFAQAFCATKKRGSPLVFVDCNAVSPHTARSIGQVITAADLSFVDAGIIGLPPAEERAGPRLYVAGPDVARVTVLNGFGLEVVVLDGEVGAASALKMAYAGINKGLIAVATAMIQAASREGVAHALEHELSLSDPLLLAALSRRVPDMLPKAYRWVAEMREIGAFVRSDAAAAEIYEGAAKLYERIAADHAGPNADTRPLRIFFEPKAPTPATHR